MEGLEKENPIFSIAKGIIIAIVFTIVALSIFSVILVYTDISEETIDPVILVITAISILVGSSIGTRKLKKNGLLNGGIIGISYILVIYLLSSMLTSNFALNRGAIIMMIAGIIGGVIGGIIGVNLGK